MQFSIRKLDESDWREFAHMRLSALKADPGVFGSNFAAESKNTETEWRLPLKSEDSAIFIIERLDEPVGITCISVYRDDPSNETAILWGSWLKPAVRGKGLSSMMYETRIRWAKTHRSVKKVIVSHRESNEFSKRANQRFGFRQTTVNERTWPDGIREREFHYELNLGKPC